MTENRLVCDTPTLHLSGWIEFDHPPKLASESRPGSCILVIARPPYKCMKNTEVYNCCSICLDFIKQESYLDLCLHKFCYQCISRWLEASHSRSGMHAPLCCPLCKTENSSIIHSFVGSSFQRQYVGEGPTTSFTLSDAHKYRLKCYASEPGNPIRHIYDRFHILGYWKCRKYLKQNQWLHIWLKRELQALMQDEDVDIIFHHILGAVESLFRRMKEETKGTAEQKRGDFRTLVYTTAERFLFEKTKGFVDELELFLASGLNVDAYDELYIEYLQKSDSTDHEARVTAEESSRNIYMDLFLEDTDK